MSDALGRVSVKVWVEDFEFGEDFQALTTSSDLVAAVRDAVESGTIEGEVGHRWCVEHDSTAFQGWKGCQWSKLAGHTDPCRWTTVLVVSESRT